MSEGGRTAPKNESATARRRRPSPTSRGRYRCACDRRSGTSSEGLASGATVPLERRRPRGRYDHHADQPARTARMRAHDFQASVPCGTSSGKPSAFSRRLTSRRSRTTIRVAFHPVPPAVERDGIAPRECGVRRAPSPAEPAQRNALRRWRAQSSPTANEPSAEVYKIPYSS